MRQDELRLGWLVVAGPCSESASDTGPSTEHGVALVVAGMPCYRVLPPHAPVPLPAKSTPGHSVFREYVDCPCGGERITSSVPGQALQGCRPSSPREPSW